MVGDSYKRDYVLDHSAGIEGLAISGNSAEQFAGYGAFCLWTMVFCTAMLVSVPGEMVMYPEGMFGGVQGLSITTYRPSLALSPFRM